MSAVSQFLIIFYVAIPLFVVRLAVTTSVYEQLFSQFLANPLPAIGGTASIIGYILSQRRKGNKDDAQRQREALTTWKDLADSRQETINSLQAQLKDVTTSRDLYKARARNAEERANSVARLEAINADYERRMRDVTIANTPTVSDQKNLSESED